MVSYYAQLVHEVLADEQRRRADRRESGRALISSSGTLVALNGAVIALMVGSANVEPAGLTKCLAALAIAFFVIAALLGLLLSHAPAGDAGIGTSSELRDYVESDALWNRDAAEAARAVALAKIKVIEDLKEANMTTAWLVLAALSFQVLGVVLLAVATVWGVMMA